MGAAKKDMRHIHLAVPADDERVCAWLSAQRNISASLRLVIAQQAQETGNVDMFDLIIANPPKRRGRPASPYVLPEGAEAVSEVATPAPKPVAVAAAAEPSSAPAIHVDPARDALDSLPSLSAIGARPVDHGASAALKDMLDK